MMAQILTILDSMVALAAVGAGIALLKRIFSGSASCERVVLFIRMSLAGDIVAILLPFLGGSAFVRTMATISVYLAAVMALFWKSIRPGKLRRWVVLFTLVFIFCIDVQILIWYVSEKGIPLIGGAALHIRAFACIGECIAALVSFALAIMLASRPRISEA